MQNIVDIFKNRAILATYPMTFSQVMGTCYPSCERTKHYRSHVEALKYNNKILNVTVCAYSRARIRKTITLLYILISNLSIHLSIFFLAGDNIFRSLVHILKILNKKQSFIVLPTGKTRAYDRSHVHMLLTANQINL